MKRKPLIILSAIVFVIAALSVAVFLFIHHNNQRPQSFTISAPFANIPRLQGTVRAILQTIEEQERDIPVNFLHYTQDDWPTRQNLLLSKFAAGLGPDIFVRDSFMLDQFIENNFIADIYTIVDQSNDFSREDFFTNVLEGVELDGRLYMLPIDFSFDFIGINANVPQIFVERFAVLNRATISDITALYLDLINDYPEWSNFALIHGLSATEAFLPELNRAIDFAAQTADFSNTHSILENIRLAFSKNDRLNTPPLNWQTPFADMPTIQDRYVFSRVYDRTAAICGLFEFNDPFFVNYIPLANENGQLITRSHSMELVASRTANPQPQHGTCGKPHR